MFITVQVEQLNILGKCMICIFNKNKYIISLNNISPQSSCRVLSKYLINPIQPCQCSFCTVAYGLMLKNMQHARARGHPPLFTVKLLVVRHMMIIVTVVCC